MRDNSSELRQNLVSGEWAVIATGRGRRPDDFAKGHKSGPAQPKENCPFENPEGEMLVSYAKNTEGEERWWVKVIPNKFPAFHKGAPSSPSKKGPYYWMEGIGYHEVIISRDHDRSIAQMSDEEIELILRACQDRYLAIRRDECIKYISIFQNHGQEAGASVYHPHSQIIAIPVIPPDINRSLRGSENYYHENGKCVHCVILEYEMEVKERLIYENEYFLAVAPYASKSAFEARIFPKIHNPNFEEIRPEERLALANALKTVLGKLHKGLDNPDYNFFIHTSPTKEYKNSDHYHWHMEIIPKTSVWAGFEIGTGIEISTRAPEAAAEFLRNIKIT